MRRKKPKATKELVRPTAIDGHVGARVRQRRMMIGMSQQTLAGKLGITFQQLQKNEKGTNRIGCSRLLDLSQALDVPIQHFFDEMPDPTKAGAKAASYKPIADGGLAANLLAEAETLKLVRAYYKI